MRSKLSQHDVVGNMLSCLGQRVKSSGRNCLDQNISQHRGLCQARPNGQTTGVRRHLTEITVFTAAAQYLDPLELIPGQRLYRTQDRSVPKRKRIEDDL